MEQLYNFINDEVGLFRIVIFNVNALLLVQTLQKNLIEFFKGKHTRLLLWLWVRNLKAALL